ncbi:ATP-binding protein [Pseudodesulfovibrio tunisiensis]|uniref:ATP-binding protein n=1 Tax=Pseudodesulfovibrio tunisiensis TaxID=463192 RepID=UPI001FB1EFA8|nr:ATP-binding protein [Pseudodesulfovibrio tunisiensis]
MLPHAVWIMPPNRASVRMVNAGLDAFCILNGFDENHSRRIQVCLEGVFMYCARNIMTQADPHDIEVRLYWRTNRLEMFVEHHGPRGEWDDCLRRNSHVPLRRTSFEAMGLFIAREILDELTFEARYDIAAGGEVLTYGLVHSLGDEMPSS